MSELTAMRKIQVLGASGLIGRFVTDDLRIRGFDVVGVCAKVLRRATDKRV
jgi:nucleoside-diphosphate-sugar epimerase